MWVVSRPKRTTYKNPWKTAAVSSHSKWPCKCHVVFIPKYRRRTPFGVVRTRLGPVFRALAGQKECRIEESHLLADHVPMLISVPPKLAVSAVIGFIKGKSAIHVARHFLKRERNYAGQPLWARGCFVDTVGRDAEKIRQYIQEQEATDRRLDQLELPITEPNQEA